MGTSANLVMGDRGRIVIPQEIRQAQHLEQGDRLIIFEDEKGMRLMTRDQLEAEVWANLKNPEISLVDELIADRRAEALRDLED